MSQRPNAISTYVNPVHNRSCPDPYVLKYLNEYWCYCTGIWHDGRCFGILTSRDLVHWQELGGAMERLNDQATCYWAPEVVYDNGQFLMYYSVGNEEFMQIRAAIAEHPAGPFIDANRSLTIEQFAIDPHVFRDDDGKRYLFYATDFLEHTHIGTGTVYDEMLDAFTLAGKAKPVTRARFDWQIYDPQRAEKGGVRWHTVEGPFVLKHKGRYYQMFSGGNWQNKTYGVSYAVSDRILNDDEWEQTADGKGVLPILRTIPGRVIGPGHNSVVRGVNNVEMYCVYHRWSKESDARVLSIDRMDWVGERMFVIGPTTTPRPAPYPATLTDYFDLHHEGDLGANWQSEGGKWAARAGRALQEVDSGYAAAHCRFKAPYFIAEVHMGLLPHTETKGSFGVALTDPARPDSPSLVVQLLPASNEAVVEWQLTDSYEGNWLRQAFRLPDYFNFQVLHLLRVEVNGQYVQLWLDETLVEWQGKVPLQPQSIALWTAEAAAAFAGFSLTHGWEDWFTGAYSSPSTINWEIDPADETWTIRDQQLFHNQPQKVGSILTKGPLPDAYELVVSARIDARIDNAGFGSHDAAGNGYGFLPAIDGNRLGPLFTVGREGDGWVLRCESEAHQRRFQLPAGFDPYAFQQFRFRKQGGRLFVQHEAEILGEIDCPPAPDRIGLYSSEVAAAFDCVRVTAI